MATVYLLRHAKAAAGTPDRDRPLTPEGCHAAAEMGREMVARGLAPDLVLCSAARRAVQTWEALRTKLETAPRVAVEDELYSCGAPALLDRLRRLEAEVERALVVAHNPDIQELAVKLAGEGPATERARLRRKFPAGALAAFDAPGRAWRDLDRARLVFFALPK